MSWLRDVFGVSKPVIGMVHLPALPGSPLYDAGKGMEGILEWARRDLHALQDGGIDAVMFCNENDRPYTLRADPATVAAMAAIVGRLRAEIRVPFGVDILWDPFAALAVAQATGAQFVREVFTGVYASDMGFWSPAVGEVLRYRRAIGAEGVRLLFNINAEFAAPLGSRPLAEVARSVAFSSLPDGLCVSGPMTSVPVRAEDLRAVKEAVGSLPVFINTGARHDNIEELLPFADGVIVGSSLKVDGITWNPVDPERVRSFMAIVRRLRAEA
ncbi:BtpA/SgcQ family protein [Thermoflexus sp.]|uniref:BtpA/SgcQ family protein n=2 Tax=Thermoflexus sp. TaxID=1969742 RepID=UPI0025F6E835|nr:BtpA/SgcQ family protein [Thermoflexus sp.]MDW8065599.1 BtpA/SgcQ family protein [Anaerolineae bacterium]MCS6964040.1 BtpA/SgcQ family protein [Thermoflexus sp.]MCS7350476.1 BtpA/SgcQ family protein [Thermoflexus sp.]MCX7689333.1 BtpA/SgcQ family protein [Thermoflexus sp.]MDW8179927.1 BtpA/SgcQ family protein [Anaerolineae bacterium]